MTTFTETDHLRVSDGRFTDKPQTAPELTLDSTEAVTPAEVFSAALSGRATVRRDPRGVAQTRAALKNHRGEPNDSIRVVRLTWNSVPPASGAGDIEVHGPKDGRPIIIEVSSGFPLLRVKSGHAIILASSIAGHGIHVAGGASATIIGSAGRKVSITALDGSKVDFHPQENVWGLQDIEGDAQFTVHGDPGKIIVDRHPAR